MKLSPWLQDSRHSLDIVAGLIDGILNSLTLAAAKLAEPQSLSISVIGKVAAIAACTTSFVFFVAHYAQLRAELIRSARELNLLSHGQLATTALGKQIVREAAAGALIASTCGVVGSVFPLVIGFAAPHTPTAGLMAAIMFLGILGWLLARNLFGSVVLWAGGLMLSGVVLAEVGIQLNIVG